MTWVARQSLTQFTRCGSLLDSPEIVQLSIEREREAKVVGKFRLRRRMRIEMPTRDSSRP